MYIYIYMYRPCQSLPSRNAGGRATASMFSPSFFQGNSDKYEMFSPFFKGNSDKYEGESAACISCCAQYWVT